MSIIIPYPFAILQLLCAKRKWQSGYFESDERLAAFRPCCLDRKSQNKINLTIIIDDDNTVVVVIFFFYYSIIIGGILFRFFGIIFQFFGMTFRFFGIIFQFFGIIFRLCRITLGFSRKRVADICAHSYLRNRYLHNNCRYQQFHRSQLHPPRG